MGLSSLTRNIFAGWFLVPAMCAHAAMISSRLAAAVSAILTEIVLVLCKLGSEEEA